MLKRILSFLIIITVLSLLAVFPVSAKGADLIPASESQMNDISSWQAFHGGKLSMISINGENVLCVTGLGKATWHSPAYDIYNIIRSDVLKKGGGRYQISFSIALQVTGDEEQNISTTIRGTNQAGIFDMYNNDKTEFWKQLSAVFGKDGEWKDYSITVGIQPEDVQKEGEKWLFCFDRIPEAVTGMYIDDFSVCRYSDDGQQTVLMHSCVPSKKTFSGVSSKVTPTPKADNTVQATPAPTPVPRVTPSVSAGKTEEGKNLLDDKTSTLDNVNAVGQTAWTTFSTIGLSISDEGYSGSALRASTHSVTWASPAINIFPYIKEAGTYTFSIMVKVAGGADEAQYSFIIRGTRATSFIEQRGGNFYGVVGSKKLKEGEWTRITGQFTVSEADISQQDTWTLCVSNIPLEVEELFIDEAVLIKGTEKQLPEMKEPDAGVSVNMGSLNKYAEGELYKPELKNAIITTSIITLILVVLIIAGSIFLPKLFKKGQRK